MDHGFSGPMGRFLPGARPISSARPTLSPEIVTSGQTHLVFLRLEPRLPRSGHPFSRDMHRPLAREPGSRTVTPKVGDTWRPGFGHVRPFRKIINGFRLIFDVKVDVLVEAERPWNFEGVQARRGETKRGQETGIGAPDPRGRGTRGGFPGVSRRVKQWGLRRKELYRGRPSKYKSPKGSFLVMTDSPGEGRHRAENSPGPVDFAGSGLRGRGCRQVAVRNRPVS
jgi:hypothetical protein